MHPMKKLIAHLVLPKEITEFEAQYLQRMNRVGLIFFAIHVPVMVLLAWLNATNPKLALALSLGVVAGPALAYRILSNPRAVSMVYGVTAMFMGGLLVHFGQGPVQIEMHFYFFALIAMLAVYGNPLVILAAALTVALHHLVLWFTLPQSVFNYNAPVWVVAVHALFVVLESVAGCYIARNFFDNVIGLEKIVHARTEQLRDRTRDMRRVLDNVTQGFLTIDRDGLLSAERSRMFDRWFEPSKGETLFDVFERKSPEFAEQSRVAWTEVVEGVMPRELTLDQMPSELEVGDTQFRFAYLPVVEGDQEDRALVVVTDVTAERLAERAERDRREGMVLVECLLEDRNAVLEFFEEGSGFIGALLGGQEKQPAVVARALHTLKGNSAIFGMESVAALCHELETRLSENGGVLAPRDLTALRERWDGLSATVDRLLGTRRRILEIREGDHAALEQGVRRGLSKAALLAMVHAIKLEPTHRRLEHFGEQAKRIASRLGKEVNVLVEGNDLRVDPKGWGGFWSAFVHAVRNAVDHGLEPMAERAAQSKGRPGTLVLRTRLEGERFVVEIGDDGRGVDWTRIAAKAHELGLPASNDQQLREALFRDGVSTAARVTDLSGRGVGMGAVRAATEALGGILELETETGRGTTLRMVFPKAAMTPDLDRQTAAA